MAGARGAVVYRGVPRRRPVCLRRGVGFDSSVPLIVAALDLELVRLVRAAMRTEGGVCGRVIHPEPVIEPRRRIDPEPEFEPRKRIHPTPVFEPRRRHRPEQAGSCCAACVSAAPVESAEKVPHAPSPVEPPWKVLPWDERMRCAPARPVRKIKVLQVRPDIQCKGSVIDLFI